MPLPVRAGSQSQSDLAWGWFTGVTQWQQAIEPLVSMVAASDEHKEEVVLQALCVNLCEPV